MEDNLQINLANNGFVIIDILSSSDVAYLNELCNKFLQNASTDFVSSSHILNKVDSDFINDELHKILQQKFENLFPELQLLGGTLATKVKGKSNLEAHQDWTIVDEQKYNSYNLWIPLVDTDSNNGTLGLIVGSHKWNQDVRGFNIPNPYGKYTKQFLEIGFEPTLKAGQAILYNHKLIHYSRPNATQQNRNVAIIGVKDKAADLQISFTLDNKTIDCYDMKEELFYQFNPNNIVTHQTKIASNAFKNMEYSAITIQNLFKQHASEDFLHKIINHKIGFVYRFKHLFERIFRQ